MLKKKKKDLLMNETVHCLCNERILYGTHYALNFNKTEHVTLHKKKTLL